MVDRCDENVNSTLNHSSDSVKTTATLQTKDEDGRVSMGRTSLTNPTRPVGPGQKIMQIASVGLGLDGG